MHGISSSWRAAATQATKATKSNEKSIHVSILAVPSPTAFTSCILSLGRDLVRRREGRECRRAGQGCSAPAPGGALGSRRWERREALPNLALLCHLALLLRIAAAPHGNTAPWPGWNGRNFSLGWFWVFLFFLNVNSHQFVTWLRGRGSKRRWVFRAVDSSGEGINHCWPHELPVARWETLPSLICRRLKVDF